MSNLEKPNQIPFYEKKIGDTSIKDIILKTNLYKKIKIDWKEFKTIEQYSYDFGVEHIVGYNVHYSEDMKTLMEFMSNEYIIYGKCPKCNEIHDMNVQLDRPLDEELLSKPIWGYAEDAWDEEGFVDLTEDNMKEIIYNLCKSHRYIDKYFSCPICRETYRSSFTLTFEKDELSLIKIGQYCSIRDFNENYTNPFVKNLKRIDLKKDYEESLITHDEGHSIAAYTYMRRVIEKLVLNKFNEKERDKSIEEFKKLHFDKKIKYLKSELPELLQNKNIYTLCSAGIHTLTEDECEEYFSILKNAVELIIIDEEKQKKEKSLREKTTGGLQKAINEIEAK